MVWSSARFIASRAARNAARPASSWKGPDPGQPLEHHAGPPLHLEPGAPGRLRRDVMKEHARLARGHAGEAWSVEDAAVEVQATFDAHRVEQQRHRTRGLDGRGDRAVTEDARAARANLEDRDRRLHAAGVEAALGEQALEALAKEPASEQPRAHPRIPEVAALERLELPRQIRRIDPRRPRAGHERTGARARDA
jgi:hypothetical protein